MPTIRPTHKVPHGSSSSSSSGHLSVKTSVSTRRGREEGQVCRIGGKEGEGGRVYASNEKYNTSKKLRYYLTKRTQGIYVSPCQY